jgi:hypothetical protein
LKFLSRQRKRSISERGGKVYFCVDKPDLPYKGVRERGVMRIHEDIGFNVPIAEKIMVKYLGNIMALALLDTQTKGQSVILEISPKYYSTWDYSS